MHNNFEPIMVNRVGEFDSPEVDFLLLAKNRKVILDDSYFDFITISGNGGFYFSKALQIYSYSTARDFTNIFFINDVLQVQFGRIADGLLSFGQDAFGNQFAFDLKYKKIIFFNIETGERKTITAKFDSWCNSILNDLDYYLGKKLVEAWLENEALNFNQRLSPKIPFILGGDYTLKNVYASVFPDFIKTSANIAKQVYDLPDGTQFKIKIEHPNS